MSSSKWNSYNLDEVYEFASGLSKSRKEFGFGYPFVTFKDVFYNFFIPDELTELANTTEKERERCSVKRGDVFLTRTSETMDELGKSSVALKDYESATFNGFTKRLRTKGNVEIYPEYAGYYFRSPSFRAEINSMATMTTRASLNNEMMARLKIVVPDIEEQKVISKVLLDLDKKIEVNNKINKKLEEMAQAIFKQWFVDFEFPNEDGKPYKSSSGEMVESELGMIPKGWEVDNIYKISDVIYGAPFSSKKFNEEKIGLPLIRIRDLKTSTPTFYTDEEHKNATKVNTGNILVGMDAEFTPTIWKGKQGYLNQRVCMFKSNKNFIHDYYIYESIKPYMKLMEFSKVGTTVIHLGKGDIDNLKVVVAERNILKSFSSLIEPIYNKIVEISNENRILIDLRDILLPKLMSGEIRVSLD